MRVKLFMHITLTGLFILLTGASPADADTVAVQAAFNGQWVINEKLSDDTDKQVEIAIIAAGGRAQRGGKGRYRGGPEEHALYDHISYDEVLEFNYTE